MREKDKNDAWRIFFRERNGGISVAVTVEQIMELETINQMMRLVAGHGGLKNRSTYVTIAEAPDFYEWVSGGDWHQNQAVF